MNKISSTRKSNIELLRIISIFLVILSHFNIHIVLPSNNMYTINVNWIIKSIFTTGCIANNIFIIITGYFMIKSKPNYKKIVSLILEMLFYSFSITTILLLLSKVIITPTILVKTFFPMFWGNWFCINYIVLYLLIPILNAILNYFSKKDVKKLIILLAIIISIIPTFTINAWAFSKHAVFILSYLIGAYIRLYFDEKNNIKRLVKLLIINIFITVLSVLITYFLGIMFKANTLILSSAHFLGVNYSIFVIIISTILFLIFKNLNIKNNKKVNWIAESTLGVYLIHENFLLRDIIWNQIFPNNNYIDKLDFFVFAIFKVLVVFIICLIIDKIRIALFGKIEIYLSEKIVNLYERVKSFIIKKLRINRRLI